MSTEYKIITNYDLLPELQQVVPGFSEKHMLKLLDSYLVLVRRIITMGGTVRLGDLATLRLDSSAEPTFVFTEEATQKIKKELNDVLQCG